MAAKPPDAFLSYTRFDDQNDGGAISAFRRRLAGAVRAATGVPFEIFQDVEGIGIGEHWPGKLDQMLDETRFFLPILTPSYFTSGPGRDELEKFLRIEAERGRNDLVHDCVVPDLQIPDLGLRLQDIQWVDLWQEGGLDRLVTAIQTALGAGHSTSGEPPPAVAMPRRDAAAISSAALLARAALTWEPSTDLRRSTHVNLQDTLALPDHGVTSRPEVRGGPENLDSGISGFSA